MVLAACNTLASLANPSAVANARTPRARHATKGRLRAPGDRPVAAPRALPALLQYEEHQPATKRLPVTRPTTL